MIRPTLELLDERSLINATLTKPAQAVTGDPDYLEKIRWYFLLACHTGLRRSDQWQFINPVIQHIENTPCLMVLQQKTGNRVAIPLSAFAYDLLKHPHPKKPPMGDSYNRILRTIGEQAGLVRPVTVGSFTQGSCGPTCYPYIR